MKGNELSKNLHIYGCLYRQIAEKRFEENGIYFGQPPILKFLSEHPGASQNEIAEFLNVSPASIATSVKRMEKSGLIERSPDEKDARKNTLNLTEKGIKAQKRADETIKGIDDEIFGNLPDEDACKANEFMKLLNQNIIKLAKENNIKVRKGNENV